MSIKYFQPNESVPRSKLYDMDYLRNLKLNHDKLAIMRPRIDKYQKMIKWKGNAECNNIEEMVQAAKLGLDCGLEKTVELAPVSGFHQWVAYCFVHTRLYNRDRTSDRLPANMSRNFFNILEGFQKVEESLDGPEGQYVEDC